MSFWDKVRSNPVRATLYPAFVAVAAVFVALGWITQEDVDSVVGIVAAGAPIAIAAVEFARSKVTPAAAAAEREDQLRAGIGDH